MFTLVWVKDYIAWAKTFSFIIPGFISTIFIFAYIKDIANLIKGIELVVWVSILYSVMAFYEIFTGNYFFLYDDNFDFYNKTVLLSSATGLRPPVTVFGNPNDYSLFLFFSLVFSFVLFKIKETGFARLFYFINILINFFLIICTQSRSTFWGIVIFFFVYMFFSFLRKSFIHKSITLITTPIVLLLAISILKDYLWFFNDVTAIEFEDNSAASSDSIRINLIKNGLIFLYKTGFMGVGLGNIEYYMKSFQIYDTAGIENMHNWWMEILVSSGVIIFAIYITVYFSEVFKLYLNYKKTLHLKIKFLYIIFLCYFVSFIISSIGASSLISNEWTWPLMAMCMRVTSINIDSFRIESEIRIVLK